MELNKEQQAAVFCTDNAVVSAGAGSGKTMVLANRFVWLLTEKGYKVDEILTLTFTKKAAAQMYKRIYSLVAEIAEIGTGIKAKRAQEALRDFIKARIQTLDSYSASIVKQSATRYGLSPDFQIDQERCRKIALQVSYPYLIMRRNHPAIERLYIDSRPNEIVHNVFADMLFNYSLIGSPVNFLSDVKNQFSIICIEWEKLIKETILLIKEIESCIAQDPAWLPDIVPVINNFCSIKNDIPDKEEIKKYFDFLLASPVQTCMEKALNHPLQNKLQAVIFYLSEINNINLSRGKKKDNPIKENVKLIKEKFAQILSIGVSCSQAGLSISILPLLTELQEQYLEQKRAESVLTFSDTANLARTILLEHKDIRQSEKESFKAIMIDEFQDNNDLQKELLFLLAEKPENSADTIPSSSDLEKGKLFFVGDEKQSIYLFRGADVSVFRRLKDEIASLEELPLKVNYRSSPKLINAFNAIMPSVFAPGNQLPLYEADFSPLEAYNKFDGKLTLCIHNSCTNEDEDYAGDSKPDAGLPDKENEAHFIAKKIRELINSKKYKPGDIALLFRTRSGQHLYEKHLRLFDIPYASEDIGNLFYGGPVNDIMSVLRLAAHPLDNASYAEMLRSPFAGLSLAGTALCLSFFCNNTEDADSNPVPFDDKPLEQLDAVDKEKYLNGRKVYLTITEKSNYLSVSELVSDLWYNKGYQYETEWNPQVKVYCELFDYLYHIAVTCDRENKGLADFTDLIQSYRDSETQLTDIDIPLERAESVHLMTIHKSKGLEFPVVFLCGCGKKSRTDTRSAFYYSEKTGIALSLPVSENYRTITSTQNNFFWQMGHEETKRKDTAELRRLLYVGMTRAEKELYITGSLRIKESDNEDNDFYLSVKNQIKATCEEKWKKKPNAIQDDIILDNDTLFGLLLPSITLHKPGSFYELEEIPAYPEDAAETSGNQYSLKEFIEKKEDICKKAKIIRTPVVPKNHKSPVSLKEDAESVEEKHVLPGRDCSVNREYSGEDSFDIFNKVDSLLGEITQSGDEESAKFNSGSFGSIAHICVESILKNIPVVIPANISGSLSPSEYETLLEAGNEIALRFVRSPLGLIAKNATYRENEFPFRSIIRKNGREVFINGTIDLFFEDNDFIHIVDFKTDARENPAEHTPQMTCYYRAVSELFVQKKCRIWLYYLRTGHAVEMTEKVKKYNLEQRAFS